MNYPDVDIMIDSASRPFLLEKSLSTIHRCLKYSGNLHWYLHEAFLFPDLSAQCIHIGKYSGFFEKIYAEVRPKGQGISISNILNITSNPYFIHWEDDYKGVREIDLDFVIRIMEENIDVNQIAFNKRGTMSEVSGWKKTVVKRSGMDLTTSPHWRYTPAIWRSSYFRPKWKKIEGGNSHWDFNAQLKGISVSDTHPPDRDYNWVIKHTGTYYLGGIGNAPYTNHIGSGFSNRIKGL